MLNNNSKRIWSKIELTVAYYMAKWDMHGIQVHEEDLVSIIGNTSLSSFRMQTANFRYLLNIEGPQLTHASKKMKELVSELDNKTMTQVKKMVIAFIKESDISEEILSVKENNRKASKRKDELNAQYQNNFQNKIKELKRYRNIRRK